jgi:hypothetical protein
MIRLLFALASLTAPAAAQEPPEWVGVWEGRVGTYPVRLCVDAWDGERARGSYYYRSQLEPIQLSDDDENGGWIESSGDQEAHWRFTERGRQHLRGTWRQGAHSLRFDLQPVAWSEGEWGGPCSAAVFIDPLLAGGHVESEEVIGGDDAPASYERLTYIPPAHLADDVAITTFTFPPQQPGDPAINAALRAALPGGAAGDDLFACMGGALSALGFDGSFDRSLTPVLTSDAFLVVDESDADFCGGAHPNYWTALRTFDRQSGVEVDLFDWVGAARVEGEAATLAPKLRALAMAHWPSDAEAECREYAADNEYWSIGLARDGLVFQPDLPHVATACEERVTVEWDALAPFLDAEGKAGLQRLRE